MSSGDGGCGSGPLPLGPQRAPWPGPHATSRELPDLDSSSAFIPLWKGNLHVSRQNQERKLRP